MTLKKTFRKEFGVAFSKNAQPIWFRLTKWTLFISITYLLYRTRWFWIWVLGVLVISFTGHFIYRWKTNGWTKSWRGWDSKTGEWKPKIFSRHV